MFHDLPVEIVVLVAKFLKRNKEPLFDLLNFAISDKQTYFILGPLVNQFVVQTFGSSTLTKIKTTLRNRSNVSAIVCNDKNERRYIHMLCIYLRLGHAVETNYLSPVFDSTKIHKIKPTTTIIVYQPKSYHFENRIIGSLLDLKKYWMIQ